MKTLDKSVRTFDVYKGLNLTIDNFLKMLPLVNALRDPSMRDRHWDALKERTGKFFTMSKDFNLGDMMALELHSCPDDVDGVVEMAKSEEKTEKVMEDMKKAWAGDGGKIIGFEFSFKPHPSNTFMFSSTEEMTEKLEENMLALQTILGGKNFEHFESELIEWRDNLNNVDVTVNLWRDVQQTWSYLESIFMSSEDIRNQLPEETKLFETIDKKWKNMMAKASKVPNVVDCCGDPAMLKTLETLRTSLTVCEKKLNDYLETKRKAFPRFYFVAPADLLLMLSQGTNPHAVTGKISSMTDNTGKLEWRMDPCEDKDGKPTGELDEEGNVKLFKSKVAIGMFSKEDE
jgi:dynein heavy chain